MIIIYQIFLKKGFKQISAFSTDLFSKGFTLDLLTRKYLNTINSNLN